MDPRQPFGRPIPAVRDLPLSGANQMTLAFDPHVFGSAALTWVSLLTLAGIALTVGLLLRGAARIPAPRSAVYAVALRSVLWGLLGARLLHDLTGEMRASSLRCLFPECHSEPEAAVDGCSVRDLSGNLSGER